MAYIVLALGAFLSIGGALSIFHGAGIVEVERGWTGVIAGATALTGGIVTITLGLILKTLLDLRPALMSFAAIPALPTDVNVAHDFEARTDHEPPATPESSASAPTSLMTAELESGILAAILTPTAPAIEHEESPGARAERAKTRTLPVVDAFETATSDHETPEHDRAPPERDVPAIEPQPQHPEPLAEKSRFKVNFKKQPPEPLPPEPAPIPAEEPAAPALDDWLDRAFSAFDHEAPLGPHRAAPHTHEETRAPVEEPSTHAETAASVAEPTTEQPHETAPPPPAPTSAVIGRYEADGTSYVMYADGSIEAQSDAGIHRFNSMTELKAFIESAET